MRLAHAARVLGIFLMLFSFSLLPPLLVSRWYADGEAPHFLYSMFAIFGAGLLLWLPSSRRHIELRNRDGFLIVAFYWIGLGLLGALPFMFGPHLSYVDSVFEAVSGFTTTGATVIVGLDALPPSILYYRAQLQWLGGMGVIVLAVAILPMLGIGGMQLFRAETPGPMKDDKLTPRITHTARALWLIYFWLTVACAVALWLAGMTPFDAITHSFTALSTGGFSSHDDSVGYFKSPLIDYILILFMLLGGINFSVHFVAWHGRSVVQYWRDTEVRGFLWIVGVASAVITAVLYAKGEYPTLPEAFRYATFQVVSVITTTGFGTANLSQWPLMTPVLLMFIGFIGGCAGSTAGGMKVVRVLLVAKQALREMFFLVYPKGLRPIKLGNRVLPERTIQAVWGFFSLYVATFVVLMVAMMALGVDQVTAFSAVATCINNVGPGLGKVATNFHDVSDGVKIISTIAMLLGRLEIFTMLVILSPAFWRR